MAMGRGSAGGALTTTVLSVLLLCVLLLQSEMAHAVTYTVGGTGGWTFNTVNWPKGKRFRAGGVLVFKYNSSFHNVVRVNGVGYKTCKTPMGAQVFKTGSDRIKLVKGQNFFICNFVGHCESGMKLAINAV
ncbi:Plastocyanin-like [Macleaya cordata]|uniref:Plantacyanin n=1 Tax=Macleaya cordata TaxID=56857 RepID=A0A200Q985_MACCD|nr:Plastocyanin-like [Macleaya cordata]